MMGLEQYDWHTLSKNIELLMKLVGEQRDKIKTLEQELRDRELSLAKADKQRKEAEANSNALLTVRAVAGNDEELRQTRERLDRLIRDVDRCIALLEVE